MSSEKVLRHRLEKCDDENTPEISFDGVLTQAKVIGIYDADTITLAIPFEKTIYKTKCRLAHIDSAEKRKKSGEPETQEEVCAKEGTDFLKGLILNKVIWTRCGGWDKYGRLLVEIYQDRPRFDKDGNLSINILLVKKGYAYLYDGKKKKTFVEWHGVGL